MTAVAKNFFTVYGNGDHIIPKQQAAVTARVAPQGSLRGVYFLVLHAVIDMGFEYGISLIYAKERIALRFQPRQWRQARRNQDIAQACSGQAAGRAMDPVTHAASGVVAMLALDKHPASLWALPLAALACASPDIDLAFIHTPLQFLQLHRGITHSLAGAPVLGLLLALLCYPLWRKSTPGRWSFPKVWLFCICMVLLHIWLDIVTTYGTMIFLPFSHYRVRLNSLFIIDLFVTLPLLWAIWRWRQKRALILAVLAWTFIYPASGIAVNAWHAGQWRERLMAENRQFSGLLVLPDAFAPFFWRVLYEDGTTAQVMEQSINVFGQPRAPVETRPAANETLVRQIAASSIAGETYFSFSILPVMQKLRPQDAPPQPAANAQMFMFYDLRFGSGLRFARKLMAMRPNADMPFQLMAEFAPKPGETAASLADLKLDRIRLRFSDSGRDSSWHRPLAPQKPDLWQWLVGIN